jgi:hypothetical protein
VGETAVGVEKNPLDGNDMAALPDSRDQGRTKAHSVATPDRRAGMKAQIRWRLRDLTALEIVLGKRAFHRPRSSPKPSGGSSEVAPECPGFRGPGLRKAQSQTTKGREDFVGRAAREAFEEQSPLSDPD